MLKAMYELTATALAKLYLSHHYNRERGKFEKRIQADHSILSIPTEVAAERIIQEFSQPMTAEEAKENWYQTGGSTATIETLNDYAWAWRLSRARARQKGRGQWFWKSKRRPLKLNYRPFYQDLSMREQMPIVPDVTVYRHAKENGVDVSNLFVTTGFEGGKGKDAFNAVCTADAWKVEYCEEHKLDPNEDYGDAS